MNVSLKSVPSQEEAQWQARVDLAACHRIAVRLGMHQGIDNHLTTMVPGHSNRFYLAPFGLHWSELRASDFCEVDFDKRLVAGKGPIEDSALYIHLPIHRVGPRAYAVLHTHMPHATALTMLEDPTLEMGVQSGLMFHNDIAYVDYDGLAFNAAEGERLGRSLGDKSVLMMRNHGALTIGRTLPEAFERLYFLEKTAEVQLLAMSTGRPRRLVPEAIIQKSVTQIGEGAVVGGVDRADLHFQALKRLLDRSEADYAT